MSVCGRRSLSVDFLLSNTKILQGESGSEVRVIVMKMMRVMVWFGIIGLLVMCQQSKTWLQFSPKLLPKYFRYLYDLYI